MTKLEELLRDVCNSAAKDVLSESDANLFIQLEKWRDFNEKIWLDKLVEALSKPTNDEFGFGFGIIIHRLYGDGFDELGYDFKLDDWRR